MRPTGLTNEASGPRPGLFGSKNCTWPLPLAVARQRHRRINPRGPTCRNRECVSAMALKLMATVDGIAEAERQP